MRPFEEYEKETNSLLTNLVDYIYRDANDFSEFGLFPHQALNYVRRVLDKEIITPNFKMVNVTVFLAPGDYYLFNCFGKFVEDDACELQSPAIDWCGELQLTLPQDYTKYDNIHYHFVNMCTRLAEIQRPFEYDVLSSGE